MDVAVFCLSLMGTNIRDFLQEANRVLKPGGLLKVAEVSSRFEDVRTFLGAVIKLGFKVICKVRACIFVSCGPFRVMVFKKEAIGTDRHLLLKGTTYGKLSEQG